MGTKGPCNKECCLSESPVTPTPACDCCPGNCCEEKLGQECVCLCKPSHCLCHTATPCCMNDSGCQAFCGMPVPKPNQCYYAWPFFSFFYGMGVFVFEEGKKFRLEWCFMPCGEYEMVEDGRTSK